ncbi:Cleavage and polyadenylation specificity factor subunit 2 [Entamoeba marina]
MQTIQVRTLFSTGNGPFSTLLCIGQINILLDCGIDDGLNKTTLSVYDTLPPIHYILLSHGDLKHIGALPYLLSRNPNVEIYATDPVGKIGYLSMLDGMKVQQQQGYPCYKPRELEASYKRVFLLEYYKRQKLEYFEIIALPSGRTLGGSNWRIVKDCDEIVYA